MTGLEHLGIDELARRWEVADRQGDTEFMGVIEAELKTRDTEGYEQRQAEANFGA